jgi:opacity protein-like surface antigen
MRGRSSMKRALYFVNAVASIVLSATTARAADLLGLYVGGSLGKADVRSSYLLTFAGTDAGWKAFVGARPISFAGIEVAYTDFGHATAPLPTPSLEEGLTSDNSRQQAATILGVGYLPLPVPFLDLYGKVGVARLDTQQQIEGFGFINPPHFTIMHTQWSTDFTYGAGVQAKFGQLALRAEYERINASGGDPTLLSLGILWRF